MSKPESRPSPELFFDSVHGFQRTAVLKGAIDLDVFTRIDEGAVSAGELAGRCQASERGMRILCDCLVVMGFLTKQSDRYGLTPDSAAFLSRKSSTCLGRAIEFLLAPGLVNAFRDVAALVRKGGTLDDEGATAADFDHWVDFARSMAPLAALSAGHIAELLALDPGGSWEVLDVAAGHGLYGLALARAHPGVRVTAVDWPRVLEAARENAAEAGLLDRFSTIAGDAFEVDFGQSYDLVLLTNFLHHFDPETCGRFLKKVRASLKEEGRAVTLEFVPDEDRVSPPRAALFAMQMLGTTPAGDAYTFSEFQRMFESAGFASSEMHELPGFQRLIISRRTAGC